MSCAVAPNCSGFPHSCPASGPDADVSGIGVVWGFGVTSFITLALSAPIALLSLADFLLARYPQLRQLAKRLHMSTEEQHSQWVDNLVHIIIGLSDQQLITGLAILIVGFSKHCSMSARHFWVIFDLAWFSAVTHLASLPVLNYYLHDYPRWRDFRVALMLSNFGFLIAAAILTFGNYDPKSHDCPIQCIFNRFQTSDFPISQLHVTQMVFITCGFTWALVHLYAPDEIWRLRHSMIVGRGGFGSNTLGLQQYFERKKRYLGIFNSHTSPKDVLYDNLHLRRTRFTLLNFFSRFHEQHKDSVAYLIFRWILLMLFAPPSAIVWANLVSMWAMGAARLAQDRQWSVGAENEWGFGQVLPLLLLVFPFFTVTEVAQEFQSKGKSGEGFEQITAYDLGTHEESTFTTPQITTEGTPHVESPNMALDHVTPTKLVHYPSQPSSRRLDPHLINELPRRSSTYAPGAKVTAESLSITSSNLPLPQTYMPPSNRRGYGSLLAEEPNTERHVASSTVSPFGIHVPPPKPGGYDSLPAEESNIEQHVAATTVGPLGIQEYLG